MITNIIINDTDNIYRIDETSPLGEEYVLGTSFDNASDLREYIDDKKILQSDEIPFQSFHNIINAFGIKLLQVGKSLGL